MSLRCPYCHEAPPATDAARCRTCGALAHPGCALELGACAACGRAALEGGPWPGIEADGWRRVAPSVFVREAPPEAPVGARRRLRLALLSSEPEPRDLLAGAAAVVLPRPGRLGPLRLELRPGRRRLLDRWRAAALLRCELAPARAAAPGTYRFSFRIALEAGPELAPGARLALALEGRRPLRGSLPLTPQTSPVS